MEKWLSGLTDEELSFIKKFILNSGSLKKVAHYYKVSYPTIRIKTDQLIKKIKSFDISDTKKDFKEQIMNLVIEDEISLKAAEKILAIREEETKK
ncbi:DUF2089 family protein [Pediococcus acidilactici]|uniref:DUF2089 family protein n=1 Tax=Pediococcus acidilactici TaxID=1254 RepID=UPI001BD4B005|nr:DUF2089 family protein [Pediococcus acidilactici]MBS9400075.1 DUF2089 family protein [Pediococcus acidilactici]